MRKRATKGSGTLYRQKGRKIWLFKSPPGKDGKSIVISTGTQDRKQAERIRRDHLEKMERGISLDAHKVIFSDLAMDLVHDYQVNDRKTLKDLLFRFDRHILPTFGACKAVEITSAYISSFIAKRKNENASNAEINRELSVILRTFNLGLQTERIYRKPHIAMLKEPRHRRGGYWKEGEFRTLLRHLPESIRPLVEFMWFTGWRVSDVQSLRWHNVDFEFREIRLDFGSTKNEEGEKRIFPFIPGLEELLYRQCDRTSCIEKESGKIIPFVFHRNGREIRAFNKDWYKAMKAAGIAGKKRHDFRSTAARNLLKLGFLPHEVCRMVGWKSVEMLYYYAIIDTSDLHEKARKLRDTMVEDKKA